MKLYQRTEMLRETVAQEARVVLKPIKDGDGPENSYREVQVLVPEGNGLFVGIDLPVQRGFGMGEGGIGPNRTYLVPKMPTGQAIVFRLLPEQYITAMAESGYVNLALIIEYVLD